MQTKAHITVLIGLLILSRTAFSYDCIMPKSDGGSPYDSHECVFDGLIKISLQGKYGAMDNVGIVIVPLMFEEMGEFNEGVAKVRYKNKYGFMNHQGILVVPIRYDDVGFFQNGSALVRLNDEYFMIDKQGGRVLDDKPAMPPADLMPDEDLTHILLAEPAMPEPSVISP